MTDKTCTECGETKPLDEFHRDRRLACGRAARCKVCSLARKARYYRANKDEIAKRNSEWHARTKVQRAERWARYYAENRDRIAERKAVWREENADKILAYREENKEAIRAYDAQYKADNPGIRWAQGYRLRALRFGFDLVEEWFTKADVIERYGDSCFYCETGAFEQLDHATPVSRRGPHTLDNVRPSCTRCNDSKGTRTLDEFVMATRTP